MRKQEVYLADQLIFTMTVVCNNSLCFILMIERNISYGEILYFPKINFIWAIKYVKNAGQANIVGETWNCAGLFLAIMERRVVNCIVPPVSVLSLEQKKRFTKAHAILWSNSNLIIILVSTITRKPEE